MTEGTHDDASRHSRERGSPDVTKCSPPFRMRFHG